VIETIDSVTGRGLVKVEGQTWSARLEGEGQIPEGSLVRVTGIRGVKVIVQTLDGNQHSQD
ncbi:MAG TPA: NfeD family protein, partial [Clostridia bacterium]|nr:NfeD family protein [Clostridia bacterium]